ncbi:MAG: hypothetical protein E6K94_06890 [Thaumarchaeota archaeon]|nr:MAG: hypothetical protein E6K94_06890 [Nitrososphaerota archaeon]
MNCKSCPWCATSLTSLTTATTCPSCGNKEIESVPVSAYESYRLVYDYFHGLVLEFWFDCNEDDLVR